MKKTTRRVLRRASAACLIFIGLGVAVCFGWKAFRTQQEYEIGDTAYEQLSQLVKEREKPEGNPASTETEERETIPAVNLEAVKDVNRDIAAWLTSPDTVIDYPICQGEDNVYYLTHLADGTYNRNGCLFIDCDNTGDFTDDNTIIYGHHMANGKMFASLTKYAEQRYYEAHPVMYLTVGERPYKLELFSGYVTTADSSAYRITCGSEHDFAGWIRELIKKSDFKASAMTIHTTDRIVTLSTCAYDFQNARYVVHGRLGNG